MKTKQEEIKELVLKYIGEAMLGNHNEDDIESLANSLLLDVSNEGVVIKVDRELPKGESIEYAHPTAEAGYKYGWEKGITSYKRIMREAGYIAVDPIIEESK